MQSHEIGVMFISFGVLLLLGLATDYLGRRTRLPRITLLLLFGFLIGPNALGLLPLSRQWFPVIADMALLMIAFLIGGKLTRKLMREHGRTVLAISVSEVLVTAVAVLAGLLLIGAPPELAWLLAGIAPATAPSPEMLRGIGRRGSFSRTLTGVVAVDDLWGLILFIFVLTGVSVLHGNEPGSTWWWSSLRHIGGALLLGVALGIPAALLSGRIRPGRPTLAEVLGMVFLAGGLALWLDLSFLLVAIVLGAVVANLASHHVRPFHTLENVEWPFLILFFVLAGASFRPEALLAVWPAGLAYLLLRAGGRIAGSWLGGRAVAAKPVIRNWMGVALMPQAGVATGMALIAVHHFPQVGRHILSIVVVATVLFELVSLLLIRHVVGERAGEPVQEG